MNFMKKSVITDGILYFSFAFCYFFLEFGDFLVTLAKASLTLLMMLDSAKLLPLNFIL